MNDNRKLTGNAKNLGSVIVGFEPHPEEVQAYIDNKKKLSFLKQIGVVLTVYSAILLALCSLFLMRHHW